MPELWQILKYARFYAKEQFFMKIMLKAYNYARSGHTATRHIMSAIGTFNYSLAKFLVPIL